MPALARMVGRMGGEDSTTATEKRMRLRYAGSCRLCDTGLAERTEAIYERSTKTVRCLECSPRHVSGGDRPPMEEASTDPTEVSAGIAGASARREFERRKSRREVRIRTAHPKLGGLILAVSSDPHSTQAWATGAVGEERLGARLDGLVSPTFQVLHDRRIPGTRANIDHIVICSTGVFVIDAKKYKGRPHLKVEGGILRPRVEKLLVGSRDCTKLVDGVLKQVDLVRSALAVTHPRVPVRGALCFVDADWPLIGGSFAVGGVDVLWPKRLATTLAQPGSLQAVGVEETRLLLAGGLGSA